NARAEEGPRVARVGPEDAVSPGLAERIGAARRGAERVAIEEEGFASPAVARREADLQIAEDLPPERVGLPAEGRVLRVDDELGKGVARGPALRGGTRREVERPQRRIVGAGFGRARLEVRVVIEPACRGAPERREPLDEIARAARGCSVADEARE